MKNIPVPMFDRVIATVKMEHVDLDVIELTKNQQKQMEKFMEGRKIKSVPTSGNKRQGSNDIHCAHAARR